MRNMLNILFTLLSISSFAQNVEIEIPAGSLCQDITDNVDDFTGERTFSTAHMDVKLIRVIKGDSDNSYLALNSYGYSPIAWEKGVIILFDDKSKLEFPNAEVDADVAQYKPQDFRYSSFILLNPDELKVLSEKTIDKWRLYIFDGNFSNDKAEIFKAQVECISQFSYITKILKEKPVVKTNEKIDTNLECIDDTPFMIVENMPALGPCKSMRGDERHQCTQMEIIKYISKNTKYPPIAKDAGIIGTVFVSK